MLHTKVFGRRWWIDRNLLYRKFANVENNRYICNQVSINSEVMVQVKDIGPKNIANNMMPCGDNGIRIVV
jgi:hypothetical protein